MSPSRGSSLPGAEPVSLVSPALQADFCRWAIREAQGFWLVRFSLVPPKNSQYQLSILQFNSMPTLSTLSCHRLRARSHKTALHVRKSESVSQSCLILYDPMDCSPPGSSGLGIHQERTLEWVAFPFSRGASWPRDQTRLSCIAGGFFTIWDQGSLMSHQAEANNKSRLLSVLLTDWL